MNSSIESAQQDSGFPGIGMSFVWIIVYFALQLLMTFAAMAVFIALNPDLASVVAAPDFRTDTAAQLRVLPVPTLWALALSGIATILAVWAYLSRHNRKERIGLTSWGKMPLPNTLILTIILVGGATLFNYGYGSYLESIYGEGFDPQAALTQILHHLPTDWTNTALRFAAVALIAPLVEELLFRGLLQNALMKFGPYLAIGLSSVVFAAVHLQPLAMPMLALLGAVFGYIYYRTGSLKTNIALHMINNAVALMFLEKVGT